MSTTEPPYKTMRIRVVMEDGTMHLLKRVGLSVAAAEHPDAARIENMDMRQPLPTVEDSNDG
jgi:hypothetical protein